MTNWDTAWKAVADKQVTGTTEAKLKRLHTTLADVGARGVQGSLAEIGTYLGCSAHVTAMCFPDRKLHCYDTWYGVVHSVAGELSVGALATTLESAQGFLKAFGHIEFHKGIFPDTFNLFTERFAFVYSDTDTGFGTRATLATFLPLMTPGGVILFDDIGNGQCPHNRKALDDSGVKYELYPESEQALVRA